MSDTERYLEHYNKQAPVYESVHNFTKEIAGSLVTLCPPFQASSIVLDNACGPGIVTGEIHKLCSPSDRPAIHAVDFSPGMIAALEQNVAEKEWEHVYPAVMSAEDLTFPDKTFSHSFTNFGIFLFPHPAKASREIYRTLNRGGTALVTSWLELEWLSILQEVQKAVKPEESVWQGPFAGWMEKSRLRNVLLEGGFELDKVKVDTIKMLLGGQDRDEYLATMKPTWSNMITKDWNERDKRDFLTRIDAAFGALKLDDKKIELVVSVAVVVK